MMNMIKSTDNAVFHHGNLRNQCNQRFRLFFLNADIPNTISHKKNAPLTKNASFLLLFLLFLIFHFVTLLLCHFLSIKT